MAKNIKKSYKSLIVIAGIIIILPTVIFAFIRIPAVQTILIQRITKHLSEKINSTISVGSMEYQFFNRLKFTEILIKDKNNDTLIYAPEAAIGIKNIDLRKKYFSLGRADIKKPVVAFLTDTTGEMNLMWYLDMLGSSKDTVKKGNTNLRIDRIILSDARFSLVDRRKLPGKIPTDFNNLHIRNINCTVKEFATGGDSTTFSLSDLSFTEAAGFKVIHMDSRVKYADKTLLFSNGIINSDSSILNISRVSVSGDSTTGFHNFTEDVRLDIRLEKSLVSSSDVKYFVPAAGEINESVWYSGRLSGTVAELRGRNIDISYGSGTRLKCDFDLSGLPEIRNAFIYIGINSFNVNARDVEGFNIPLKKPIKLPQLFYNLGNVSFDGSFTGFLEDFVAYGNLRTKDGTISTDVSLRPEEKNKFRVKGLVRGRSIALGRLIGDPEMLGNLSMNANIDGYANSAGKFDGKLTGLIDSVEVNSYKYRNIALNGIFSNDMWDGNVSIKDKNIKCDILGMFNLGKELPEFDFTLNLAEANLWKLNFDKSDTTSSLSALLTANFRGSNIDNLDGEMKLLNSNLRKHGENLELYDFSIKTFSENNKPAISLRTDFADADLRGYYSFSGLGIMIKSAMHSMMPSRFPEPPAQNNALKNDFTISINLKNTDKLNNFFRTGLLLADKSSLRGTVLSDSILNIGINAKTLSYKGFLFNDLSVDAGFHSPDFSLNLKSSSLNIFNQSELKAFSADFTTVPDNFIFTLGWDSKESNLNRGNFTARGSFAGSPVKGGPPVLNIRIDSTGIFNKNNLWSISQSDIVIDTNSFMFRKLYIRNKENYYLLDGTISGSSEDTFRLEFKGIDIGWLNALTSRKSSSDQFSMSFRGKLNGGILLSDAYHNPKVESNLKVTGFSLLQSDYGDLSITSAWNTASKVVDINAFNNLDGKRMLDIHGFYNPIQKSIDLTADANKLPIDALNPLLKIFASGISGIATGTVNLSGKTNDMGLQGALMVENGTLKVDYLQAKYKLNDSIRFTKNDFVFKDVKVTDEKGNQAFLNGKVHHKNFRDYTANLKVTTNDAMVLNTRQKDNDLFYGTAYATGVATIESRPGILSFDVSAKTGKTTKFFIPLNSSETVSDYSFIKFVNHDTATTRENTPSIIVPPPSSTKIELNFDLEVTPDAEVQLIFDPKAGDIMKGHGSGNLNISYNKAGEFKISGDYIIEDGDYLFTLKNILNKPFSVEEGGKITFNGDIDNAEIDMKAIYKLKASLYEILKDEKFSEKIPVECQINLSGKLFNPIVAFNIYLPTADEETRAYLRNVITTEEELSRQFLYLLVMNSFYSDPSYGSSLTTSNATTTGTSAMAVTTTEMLSNQLSNWLSQISNDFDIGFNYRPGQKDFNDQEVQVALSTQMFNDRVTINGNLDVRGNSAVQNNTDQLTGDFDIETRITDKIRFKVFNRYNNPYTGKQAPYTQGFGIFYRQDFDKFSDLFKKKNKDEMKKEDEAKPVNGN